MVKNKEHISNLVSQAYLCGLLTVVVILLGIAAIESVFEADIFKFAITFFFTLFFGERTYCSLRYIQNEVNENANWRLPPTSNRYGNW